MRLGIVGTGAVGRRLGEIAIADTAVDWVAYVAAIDRDRERLLDALVPKAELPAPAGSLVDDAPDVVVLCVPDECQSDEARRALAAGCHVVALADSVDAVDGLMGLVDFAQEVGKSVVVGAAASPGLSLLLARHAAGLFDEVDEVVMAVTGTAGPECAERRSRATRADSQEWRDGEWIDCSAKSGSELVWFPDPVGGVDCGRADLAEVVLLHRAMPDVPTVSVRAERVSIVEAATPRRPKRKARQPVETGAVRVAVSGRTDDAPSTVVYAAVAPARDSSAELALLCAKAVVESGGGRVAPACDVLDPKAALVELAGRGIRMLVYEGID